MQVWKFLSSTRDGIRVKKADLRGKGIIKEGGKGVKQEGHVGTLREIGKL